MTPEAGSPRKTYGDRWVLSLGRGTFAVVIGHPAMGVKGMPSRERVSRPGVR